VNYSFNFWVNWPFKSIKNVLKRTNSPADSQNISTKQMFHSVWAVEFVWMMFGGSRAEEVLFFYRINAVLRLCPAQQKAAD